MVQTFAEYVTLFFFYAFAGWCMESVYLSLKHRRVEKRGFLLGPCCPIYGIALVCITLFFQNTSLPGWVVFLLITLFCSVLEYSASVFMEKIFHARWWDYNDMKFNLHGRICLEITLPFGILGTFALYVINPAILTLQDKIPDAWNRCILIFLCLAFVTDVLLSLYALHKLPLPESEEDQTVEISKRVRAKLFARSNNDP